MKKMICSITAILSFVLMLSGQGRDIYTHPTFDSLSEDHRVLAILPFEVTVKLRHKQMKKLKEEGLKELEKTEGAAVQKALQIYFLKQKGKESFRVDFQDIGKTNSLLAQAGWNGDSLRFKTKEQICQLLQVDAVISGTVSTSKPLSDEASALIYAANALEIAVAISTLQPGAVGLISPGPTNTGECVINVHEAKEGKLLWQYQKSLSRGLGSNINSIIDAMMRKASRKFPYEIRNEF